MKVAVCAIAKCENPYIREWVDYHTGIGFDHIYIYDNNDVNGERCKDVVGNDPRVSVIEKYIGKKQVDCNLQIAAYNDFYMRIGHIYDWVIYLDIDEFLVIRNGSSVKEYIANICSGKGRVEGIQFNWVCYGDSGKLKYSDKPVRERFTKLSLDEESSRYKKLMYRTKLEGFCMENVHYSNVINPIIDCDGNRVRYEKKVKCEHPNTNSAYIAHYITKSLEEYVLVKKERRGNDTSGKRLSPDFYFTHNEKTDEKVELFRKLAGESIAESVEKVKPKKNVKVCVCAIAKNENLYIREWVEHYRDLGVDEIFLYDNNESDGERFEWVIGDYIDEGFVKVIDVRGIEKGLVYDKNGINLQTKCYIETYESLPDNYGWVCFFDIDEFLVIKSGDNIKDFVTNRRFWGYDTIAVSWEHFDDNGLLEYDPRPVTERFTHVSKIMRFGVKSIARTGKTIFNKKREHNIHVFLLKGKRVCHTDGSSFYISEGKIWQTISYKQHGRELALLNHYKTKTITEYLFRNNGRHWGTTKTCTTVERDFNFWVEDFFKYNEKTDDKMKVVEKIRSEIERKKKESRGKKEDSENKKPAKPVIMDPHDGISVCVTAYRAQDYIEECLDSIAAQKWFAGNDNWEVIVGIDGCERTLLKIKSIMHKYKNLRVLMMDRNMGTYVTSNTIIKEAKYNWVLRFDSDDKMRPNMVSCAIEDRASHDFVRFGFENFGVENWPRQFGMGYGVVMFNKLVFNKLGGYKAWRCGGDSDLIRRFRYNGCTIYEDKRIVFDRRIHASSLTQDKKTNFDSELRKSLVSEVKSIDYTLLSNRIANFTVNTFTEITANSGICTNIVNLATATDKDIEEFLKNKAMNTRLKLAINFRNPSSVQDKLSYLMVYDDNKMLKSKCADKILLHDYSRKILGKDICVPIIDVYDRPEDIDFGKLPNRYVLKCNHGYAMNILCKDNSKNVFMTPKNKNLETREKCVEQLNEWLGINFGDRNYQWHYALIEPKCYAEVFMDDGNSSLVDYKVWCCNGEPKMIMVISDRYTKDLHENIYDLDWNTFDIGWSCARQDFSNLDKRPAQLGKMLDYARALSKDFRFVRVDFYIINDEIYLGELTFSPNGGIFACRDRETELYWGDMIDISDLL